MRQHTIEYPIVVFRSEDDGESVADVPGIKHCSTLAATSEEALREVRRALADILAGAKERGIQLPLTTLPPMFARDA